MKQVQTMPKKHIEKKESLFDKLDEAYYSEWFTRYSRALLIAAAVIAITIIIGMRLSYGAGGKNEADYLKAQRELVQLQKGNEGAFEELNRILLRKPDLQAVYDGPVAQTLLNQHRVNEAKPFIERTLRRVKKSNLPLYVDYTRISLLISEGEYAKALEETKVLKEAMLENVKSSNRSFGDILFAYNLLRLGLLNRQAGHLEAEKQTWHELKRYARLVDEVPPTDLFSPAAFNAMLSQYEEGKISLLQYMNLSD